MKFSVPLPVPLATGLVGAGTGVTLVLLLLVKELLLVMEVRGVLGREEGHFRGEAESQLIHSIWWRDFREIMENIFIVLGLWLD